LAVFSAAGGFVLGTCAAAAPTGSANLSSSGVVGSPADALSSDGGFGGGFGAMKRTVAARPVDRKNQCRGPEKPTQ
jgi:hypothetical protein